MLATCTDSQIPRDGENLLGSSSRTGALPDLTLLTTQYQSATTEERLRKFATSLGVRTESVIAFGVGWSGDHLAWTFPMREPETGKVTGIRLRRPGGAKFSVKGGKEALFLPDANTSHDEALLVLEGASDAIAAHSIGFPNVVGRPSCTGGTQHILALVRMRKPNAVVLVTDNDEPGIHGANSLAETVALHCRNVRVICPPVSCNDFRDWVASGATRLDVETLIRSAQVRRLNIKITPKGAK